MDGKAITQRNNQIYLLRTCTQNEEGEKDFNVEKKKKKVIGVYFCSPRNEPIHEQVTC